MSAAETLGLCALLVAGAGFMARLCVEADVLDALVLIGICVTLGFLWGRV